MAIKAGELFVQLGVLADTPVLKEFGRTIAEIPMAAVGAVAAIAGIELGLQSILTQALATSSALRMFGSLTGDDTKALQRWQFVAKQSDVSADAVTKSMLGIRDAQALILTNRKSAMTGAFYTGVNLFEYDKAGKAIPKPPTQVLRELMAASKIKEPNTFRQFLTSEYGVAPEMMQVFANSQKDFNKFWNTIEPVSDEARKKIIKGQTEISNLGVRFSVNTFKGVSEAFGYLDRKGGVVKGGLRTLAIIPPLIEGAEHYLHGITENMKASQKRTSSIREGLDVAGTLPRGQRGATAPATTPSIGEIHYHITTTGPVNAEEIAHAAGRAHRKAMADFNKTGK